MRKIIDFILLVLVIIAGVFAYTYQDQIRDRVRTIIYGAPCSKPVIYTLGKIDPRFKLSHDAVLSIINKAAESWDKASGKNLLEYNATKGEVVVNFKYDRRQQVTEQLKTLDTVLDSSDANYQALKSKFNSLTAVYKENKAKFEAHKSRVEAVQQSYNEEVDSWNKRGGAPKDVYQRLQNAKEELILEYAKLEAEAAALNAEIRNINSVVAELNGSVASHNAVANKYNTINASVEPEFREGEYVVSSEGKEIDIYQYNDMNKLIRVLEHEFGHAIGLDHVESPSAIMYPLNQGTGEKPTAADLAALKVLCNK